MLRNIAQIGLLATVFSGCAARSPFAHVVPANAHPDMSAEFNGMRQAMTRQPARQAAQVAGDSTIYLHGYLACGEFRSLQELARKSPEDMENEARKILRGRYAADRNNAENDYAENYREALCLDLAAIDIIHREGLREDERSLWRNFQERVNVDPAYSAWETQRMEEAVNRLLNNHEFAEKYGQWKKQKQYRSEEEARVQYALRQTVLQTIADEIRGAFGLEPIPVYIVVFPREIPVTGYHQSRDDYIVVNYHQSHGVTNDLQTALQTLVEEAKHSVDYAFQKQMMNGGIDCRDVRAAHASLVTANNFNYVLPAANAITVGDAEYIRRWLSYERQYIERNAKEFQTHFTDALMPRLKGGMQATVVANRTPD